MLAFCTSFVSIFSHVVPLFQLFHLFARCAAFPCFRLCAIVAVDFSAVLPSGFCCVVVVAAVDFSAGSAIVIMKLWIDDIPLQYSRQDVLDDLQASAMVPFSLKLHTGAGRHQYGFVTFVTASAAQELTANGLIWTATGKFAVARPWPLDN